MSIRIIAQTDAWLAVDKPGNLPTIAAPRSRQHSDNLRALLEEQIGTPLWVVHRLDACASGIVVFAKSAAAHSELCQLWEHREVQKTYEIRSPTQGLGEGSIKGWITLGRKGAMRVNRVRSELPIDKHKSAKQAHLTYRETEPGVYIVEPQEGRRHQVRLLMALAGAPVEGDHQYYPVAGLPYGRSDSHIALRAVRLQWADNIVIAEPEYKTTYEANESEIDN